MLSETRLRKIEEKVTATKRNDYKYIFSSLEEYEQGKIEGIVDPEHFRPVLIIDA